MTSTPRSASSRLRSVPSWPAEPVISAFTLGPGRALHAQRDRFFGPRGEAPDALRGAHAGPPAELTLGPANVADVDALVAGTPRAALDVGDATNGALEQLAEF